MEMNPNTIRILPGKLIVEITEVLGGFRKSGVFVPGSTQDHMGKDTFYGKILKVGPPPSLEHYRDPVMGGGYDVRPSKHGADWPKEVMDQFKVGDIIILPRDVPVSFTWEESRYALVLMSDGLLTMDPETFDPSDFEMVPWKA